MSKHVAWFMVWITNLGMLAAMSSCAQRSNSFFLQAAFALISHLFQATHNH
jgi:hypothetical protein